MTTKVMIPFYSMYGHVHRLAEAVAEGAREVEGVEVELLRVPELVPEEVLERSGAKRAQEAFADVPVATPERLAEADAIIFGTPTRFGNMAAQMRNFLDQTGGLWSKRALVGKVGSVFTSAGTQHGGHESTLLSFHITLMHHGMIVVGVPYTVEGLGEKGEPSGGTPYGASMLAGESPEPTENEKAIARAQGRHVAAIARRMKCGELHCEAGADDGRRVAA